MNQNLLKQILSTLDSNADEYNLALAVIAGMEARSINGEYTLERFKFNSGWRLRRLFFF